MQVVGVDGCPGGWIAVAYDLESGTLSPGIHLSFQNVLKTYQSARVITVDIPIGLAVNSARACDKEARKALALKGSCVFPAPDPRLLDYEPYEAANAKSRELLKKGLSIQSYSLFPKVSEVKALMSPGLQEIVFEIHPELCFWAIAGGRPMDHPKRKVEGYEERRALLSQEFGCDLWSRSRAFSVARPAKPDDLLDAVAAAWTARRIAEGTEGRLPEAPEKDANGLRMEMVF